MRSFFLRFVSFSGSSTFSMRGQHRDQIEDLENESDVLVAPVRDCAVAERAQVLAEHREFRRRVGRSIAAIRCSSVDLPDPDGPISATNSPLSISMFASLSAMTWNSSRTNSLVRFPGFNYRFAHVVRSTFLVSPVSPSFNSAGGLTIRSSPPISPLVDPHALRASGRARFSPLLLHRSSIDHHEHRSVCEPPTSAQ